MRGSGLALLGTLVVGCADAPDPAVDTDTDVATDTVVVTDTVLDSDVADTLPDTALSDTDPHPGDLPVDTATPLAEAVDGPFRGTWAPRGGTRLVAVHVLHEGAVDPAFSHFHDTELDLDCRFAMAEDGRLRCLPVESWTYWLVGSDCATSGFAAADTCGDLRHVRDATAVVHGCGLDRQVVRKLVPEPSITGYGDLGDTGACEVRDLEPTESFLAVGDRVPPWRFVRGVARRASTGGDLDVVVVRGADGSVQPVGLYDATRDAPCSPTHFADEPADTLRCAPALDVVDWPASWTSVLGYGDDACTTPTSVVPVACDDPAPDPGLDPAGPGLPVVFDPRVREVEAIRGLGEAVTRGYAWILSTSTWQKTCRQVDFRGGAAPDPTRALLDPIPAATLPVLRRSAVGGGAVRVRAWVDAEGRALLPVDGTPFVAADGAPCAAAWDEDGTSVRCVPYLDGGLGESSGHYVDRACEDPMLGAATAAPEGTVSLRYTRGADCFGVQRVRRGARPHVVGAPLPAGTGIWQWHGWGGGQVGCSTFSWLADGDDAVGTYTDERPLPVWPELTLDR